MQELAGRIDAVPESVREKLLVLRSANAVAAVQTATREVVARQMHKRSCGLFCAFFFFGLIGVPLGIFGFAALFGWILYAIECDAAKEEYGAGNEPDGICSYYEWFLYIVGNLVGLGNPLTDVGPQSGHVFAQILDLVVAVWSLTLAALVIGLVGSFGWVTMLKDSAEHVIAGSVDKALTSREKARAVALNLAADPTGMDFDEFLKLCSENNMPISEKTARILFDSSDANKSGTIESKEVDELMEKIAPPSTDWTAARFNHLESQVRSMDAKLDALTAALQAREGRAG
jgi:hypothetical protein